VPLILKQFLNQTNQNFKINIWNNSGYRLDVRNFPEDRIRVFNSTKNHGAGDRFKLIPDTMGNPIISLDDDEDVDENFIDYHIKEYTKWGDNCILGWYSKLLSTDSYKNETAIFLPYGTEVDFLGTGGVVFPRSFFDKSVNLIQLPDEYIKVNDIYISAMAQKYSYKLIAIDPKCHIVLDGKDSNKKDKELKEKAFKKLRAGGWKFICQK
jgi:hypothetical protein